MHIIDKPLKSLHNTELLMSNIQQCSKLWTLDEHLKVTTTDVILTTKNISNAYVELEIRTLFSTIILDWLPTDRVYVEKEGWVLVSKLEEGDCLVSIHKESPNDYCQVYRNRLINTPCQGIQMICHNPNSYLVYSLGILCRSV